MSIPLNAHAHAHEPVPIKETLDTRQKETTELLDGMGMKLPPQPEKSADWLPKWANINLSIPLLTQNTLPSWANSDRADTTQVLQKQKARYPKKKKRLTPPKEETEAERLRKEIKEDNAKLEQEMEDQVEAPLSSLFNRSRTAVKNKEIHRFDDLYSLLGRELFLHQAYGNISTSKGRLTAGVKIIDTIDGTSISTLRELTTSLKDRTFKFSPVKRIYVPKPGKTKLRPIGIPTFSNKLVQEGIRMILEAIYEPIFSEIDSNHGFRPNKSPHTAMAQIKVISTGSTRALEGDIQGAYDNVDHDILMKLLRIRIKDARFLALIQNGLKAGMIEFGIFKDSLLGTPQGGIVSPLLFNIYMHEFDLYVNGELRNFIANKNKVEGRMAKPISRTYSRVIYHMDKARSRYLKIRGDTKWLDMTPAQREGAMIQRKKIKEFNKKRCSLPSLHLRRRSIFFTYIRYADDWVFLTNASKKFLEEIKERIADWITKNLKLTLSPEKTLITNLTTQKARFLGFTIYTYRGSKIAKNVRGEGIRTAGPQILFNIDAERILPRLLLKGYCLPGSYRPDALKPMSVHPVEDIIENFNSIIRGVINYYGPVTDRVAILQRIHYILEYSCYMTIAKKLSSNTSKIMKKFGRPLTVKVTLMIVKEANKYRPTQERSEVEKVHTLINYNKLKEIRMRPREEFNKACLSRRRIYRSNVTSDLIRPFQKINWRTTKNLNCACVICGATTKVEMHHITHIRDGKKTGFAQVMNQLNRNMVPLCHPHHMEVHKGLHDGIRLDQLVAVERFLS